MTDFQAAREQIAREWLIQQNRYWTDVHGEKKVNESEVPALVALLASTEQRVLEEVACHHEKLELRCRHDDELSQAEAYENVVDWCRALAQERTP